ncbi:DNA polymerase III beta subunit protein [Rhizobium phage RHph_X2_25]|nr:DNA polymerase III beta subunit protein [Rhizobium phage RHph_X2_25]
MQLTIARSDLARALAATSRVVESRSTIPILSHVLLDAADGALTVTATDLDIVATARTAVDVQKAGKLCVDAKLLSDIAKKAGADDITLSLEAEKLIVKSGRSRFSVGTLFPSLAEGNFTAEFDLDIAALFAPAQFAISTEETRYYLNGVFFVADGTFVTAVATDGHRLVRHRNPTSLEFPGIIVPRKLVGLLPKGTVTVAVSDTKIRITAVDTVLVSKLIDGTFPDYERVIPRNNDKVVTVDRDAIMKASDRVSTVSTERGRAVKLSIAPGAISLNVSNPDAAANDEVEADYSGEPFDIGFNAAYLRDVFTVLPTGPVEMTLADGGSPGLITSAGFEGLTIVLMPVRVW